MTRTEALRAVVELSAATLDEQARQTKSVVQKMKPFVKSHCADYLPGGKWAKPTAADRAQLGHLPPNTDDQEGDFAYTDWLLHISPHQRLETISAKLMAVKNKPFKRLESEGLGPWETARVLQHGREKKDAEDRKAVKAAKIEKMEIEMEKEEKRDEKQREAQKKFAAVELARTPEDLQSLLSGTGEKVGLQILREQIRQLTQVHGVSRKLLPLSKQTGKKREKLSFKELYANLKTRLERGDPITLPASPPAAPARCKRGRPSIKGKPLQKRRRKTEDGDWSADGEGD